jgi:hypothetical protein
MVHHKNPHLMAFLCSRLRPENAEEEEEEEEGRAV